MASSVNHYERMQKLQEIQYQRERQRSLLEEQLNAYLGSSDRLSKLKAAKLQNYWKKVCEDERKARVRNENLLRDFNRLESYINAMSLKTERLRSLKNQYEEQVERMYPRWKEQMEQQLLLNQLQSGSPPSTGPSTAPGQLHFPAGGLYTSQMPPSPAQYLAHQQPSAAAYSMLQGQGYGGYGMSPGPYSQQVPAGSASPAAVPRTGAPMADRVGPHRQQDLQPITEASTDNSASVDVSQRTEEILQPPSMYHPMSGQYGGQTTQQDYRSAPNFQSDPYGRNQGFTKQSPEQQRTTPSTTPRGMYGEPDRVHPVPAKRSPREKSPRVPRRQLMMSDSDEEDDTKPSEEEIRVAEMAVKEREPPSPREDFRQVEPEENIISVLSDKLSDFDISDQLPGIDNIEVQRQEERKPIVIPSRERADSGGDVSDISLPYDEEKSQELSPRQPSPRQPSPRVESRIPLTRETSRSSIASETTGPSVTINGFWAMVKAVDDDLRMSLSPGRMYRSAECSPSIKTEIIQSANENRSLSHLDPVAVSMVILRELPLLVRDTPAGSLLPDKLLSSKSSNITEANARSYMFSSSLNFWDKLLKHFSNLMSYAIMRANEIAQIFAPLLISESSSMKDKAVEVLQSILTNMSTESATNESSSTIASSPVGSPQGKTGSSRTELKPAPQASKVPDIDIDDDPDEDSFFDSNVKLTETPAYQKMIGSAQLSTKALSDDDDDEVSALEKTEEEDEIEKATRLTPTSSQTKKGRGNLLSSLGFSYGSDDEKIESKLSSSWRSGNVVSPDESSLISSPSATPRSPAYIPTGMDSGNQSRNESAAKKAAAFWDGSDLDESDSVAVPMGTGTLGSTQKDDDEDKDDFDFYD